MAGRQRWSTQEILDTATELLRTGDTESFSMRQLAAALGTDSSSLYRHFRNKTELLLAVTDRILVTAMDGHRPEGDWRQRLTAVATRLWQAFGRHPQLAMIWGRYASIGTGSRQAMEEVLQALRASGLPDEAIPGQYHRLATLLVALVSSGAAAAANTPEQYEQKMESFRVTVLGADPERFPALTHFARELRPITFHRTTFDEIIAAHLDVVQAAIPTDGSRLPTA
ncbi:TetR/AcrR family transcriptional regulator [Actinophytocola sp.]|uniref:TetR/AcrR family transcriptional regulator n=1 Tax=Actinophytocola sp. TaxID=1872138 RepID=UPI00389B214A